MDSHILVVEDDDSLRLTLIDNLELEGYKVFGASTISEAKACLEQHRASQGFDLIILDLMLPDGSGYDLCKEIRFNDQNVMILMLTARTLDSDLHAGFNSGADDYLTKPYKLDELLLRVGALLRRVSSTLSTNDSSLINGFDICWKQHRITKDGQEVHLTKKEFDLLKLLCDHIDQPMSRDEILNQVWGENVFVDTRTVDNFISNVRKSLDLVAPQPYAIKTIRGIGYVLSKAK